MTEVHVMNLILHVWRQENADAAGKMVVYQAEDEPQYEITSDKTDHIAMHKGSALKRKKV